MTFKSEFNLMFQTSSYTLILDLGQLLSNPRLIWSSIERCIWEEGNMAMGIALTEDMLTFSIKPINQTVLERWTFPSCVAYLIYTFWVDGVLPGSISNENRLTTKWPCSNPFLSFSHFLVLRDSRHVLHYFQQMLSSAFRRETSRRDLVLHASSSFYSCRALWRIWIRLVCSISVAIWKCVLCVLRYLTAPFRYTSAYRQRRRLYCFMFFNIT